MNVTALVNTSGAVVERYVYDPYGKVTILDGTTGGQTEWAADADQKSDVANEILYCGYRYDGESGLYHVRHRTYHPTLGRWLQRDPIGYADGMGLYEYVSSLPGLYVDPTGGAAIPMPGVPVGKGSKFASGLAVHPTKGHADSAATAQGIAEGLKTLCPCFSYPQQSGGNGVTLVFVQGNEDYKDKEKFCCCYYKHLAGCNAIYKIATEGGWTCSGTAHTWGGIRTEYGEQVGTGGTALRLSGDPLRDAEEYAHFAYAIGENPAKRAANLIAAPGAIEPKTERPTPLTQSQLGKAVTDLVRDKFDCKSVLGPAHPDTEQAQATWNRAEELLKNAGFKGDMAETVPRYVPKPPSPQP